MAKAIHPLEVIRRPLITEKGARLGSEHKYVFQVQPGSNKYQIKEAVEKAFNVRVVSVNVMNVKGKTRRTRSRRITRAPN